MQSTLTDIVRRLKSHQFHNEQAIKQGVVLRLLDVLGWDIYDPKTVWPEFTVDGGHVDYALCLPADKPKIFVEVKQSTTFNIGEDQLMMRYAFKHGVPVAVLTDGQRWSFYLPSGNGTFEERRFYHLDFLEREAEEIELRLYRYLGYDEVKTNRAFEAARADHDDASRKRAVSGALPLAWKEILQDADPRLIQVLLERVETSTGYRPIETEIIDFLQTQSNSPLGESNTAPTKSKKRPLQKSKPLPVVLPQELPSNSEYGENWYSVNNIEKLRSKKAIDVTVAVLRELSDTAPSILEAMETEMNHISAQKKRKVQKRRWLARSREELYDNPKLLRASVEIRPGWWLGTNYSNADKREMLEIARRVAIRYGIQLTFNLV